MDLAVLIFPCRSTLRRLNNSLQATPLRGLVSRRDLVLWGTLN
jgi:hypothetical protein